METLQLLDGHRLRLALLQLLQQTACLQVLQDGAQSVRSLRVPGLHLVTQAFVVGEQQHAPILAEPPANPNAR